MTYSMDDTPYTSDTQYYAGVPFRRGIAWVLDTILIALLCTLILPFTAFTGVFFFPVLMLVTGFLYRWFTIAGGSSTWGMRIMGIGLRDHRGAALSSGLALAHTFGYSISVAIPPLQLISVILMLVTPRGQGLTDHLLGTTAIHTTR